MSEQMIPALCQSCLRIVVIEQEKHDSGDDMACECGGQVCGCGYCMMTYALLLNGCRDKDELGLQGPDVEFEWSPHGGLKTKCGDTTQNAVNQGRT